MSWSVRVIGSEVHVRLMRLPGLRLDVTQSEAAELGAELSKALATTVTVARVPWLHRLQDWFALLRWRLSGRARRDARTRAQASLNNPWAT